MIMLTSSSQSPTAGWRSPYEIVLLIASVLFFAIFTLWEYKFAEQPILPLNIWIAPSFSPLVIVVLISFMSYGTFIWYMIAVSILRKSLRFLHTSMESRCMLLRHALCHHFSEVAYYPRAILKDEC